MTKVQAVAIMAGSIYAVRISAYSERKRAAATVARESIDEASAVYEMAIRQLAEKERVK